MISAPFSAKAQELFSNKELERAIMSALAQGIEDGPRIVSMYGGRLYVQISRGSKGEIRVTKAPPQEVPAPKGQIRKQP